MQQTPCLMSVSDEMLSEIISFIPSFDIVQHVQVVCKHFNTLINGSSDNKSRNHNFWQQRWLQYVYSTLMINNTSVTLFDFTNAPRNREKQYKLEIGKCIIAKSDEHSLVCRCTREELEHELETNLSRSSEFSQWHYELLNYNYNNYNNNIKSNRNKAKTVLSVAGSEEYSTFTDPNILHREFKRRVENRTLTRLYCRTLCFLENRQLDESNCVKNVKENVKENLQCEGNYIVTFPFIRKLEMIEIKVFDRNGQLITSTCHNQEYSSHSHLIILIQQSLQHAWRGALLSYLTMCHGNTYYTSGNEHNERANSTTTNNNNDNNNSNNNVVSYKYNMITNERFANRQEERYNELGYSSVVHNDEINESNNNNYYHYYQHDRREQLWQEQLEFATLFDFYVCVTRERKRQYYNRLCEGFTNIPQLYFWENNSTNNHNLSAEVASLPFSVHEIERTNEAPNYQHQNNVNITANKDSQMEFAGMFFPLTCAATHYRKWRNKIQNIKQGNNANNNNNNNNNYVCRHQSSCEYKEMLDNVYCLIGKTQKMSKADEHFATLSHESKSSASIDFKEEWEEEEEEYFENENEKAVDFDVNATCDNEQEYTSNTVTSGNNSNNNNNNYYKEGKWGNCKEPYATTATSTSVLLFPLRHILTYIFLLSHTDICGVQHHCWQQEKKYAIYSRTLNLTGDVVEFRFFYSYSEIAYPRMYCTMMFAPVHVNEVMSIKDKFEGTYMEKKQKNEQKHMQDTSTSACTRKVEHSHKVVNGSNSNHINEIPIMNESDDSYSGVNGESILSNEKAMRAETHDFYPEIEAITKWTRHANFEKVTNLTYNHPHMCHCYTESNDNNNNAAVSAKKFDIDDINNNEECTSSDSDNDNDNECCYDDYDADYNFDSNQVYVLFETGFGRVEVDKAPTIESKNFRRLQFALGLPCDFPLSLLWNLILFASGIGTYVLHEHQLTLLQSYNKTFTDVVEREFGLDACYGVFSELCTDEIYELLRSEERVLANMTLL